MTILSSCVITRFCSTEEVQLDPPFRPPAEVFLILYSIEPINNFSCEYLNHLSSCESMAPSQYLDVRQG